MVRQTVPDIRNMLEEINCFSRTFLATLHFNENSGRLQAHTTEGLLRLTASYPKTRVGEVALRPLLEQPTYSILNDSERTLCVEFIKHLPFRQR